MDGFFNTDMKWDTVNFALQVKLTLVQGLSQGPFSLFFIVSLLSIHVQYLSQYLFKSKLLSMYQSKRI